MFICVVDVFMGAYVIYFEIKCHHIAAVEITNDFMLFFGAELLWCCCQGSQSVFLTLVIVACFLCLIFRVELRLYCCQDSQSLLTLDLVKYLCVIFNAFGAGVRTIIIWHLRSMFNPPVVFLFPPCLALFGTFAILIPGSIFTLRNYF